MGEMVEKISVIMLTYNREKYVGRAIESVLCQTFSEFELIIVDNGSSDRSGEIAENYAKTDNRIRVVHIPKSNIGMGRNAGLDLATGEYITFVDDDDTVATDMLHTLYELVKQNQSDIAICAVDKTEGDKVSFAGVAGEPFTMMAEEAIITLMWRKHYSTGFPAKLFAAALFEGIRFPGEERYDDISMLYKVFARAKSVSYHGVAKYHVYRHENNNSAITTKDALLTPEYLRDYRKAYRDRTLWLEERYPENAEYWWYFDWSFQLSMVHKIISNQIRNCDKHLLEMQEELKKNQERFLQFPMVQEFEKEWMKESIC